MVGEERAALDWGSAGDWFERAVEEVFADKPSTAGEPKSAGIKTDKVLDELTAALTTLFDNRNVRAGASFDEELYAKARPLFEKMFARLREQEAEQAAEYESILKRIGAAERFAREWDPTTK
jgi:hypothetical protein